MTKLVTSFFLITFLVSCKIQQSDQILDIIPDKEIIKKAVKIPEKKVLKKSTNELNQKKSDLIKYHIGEPYFIEGVEYIPEENYDYDEIGLASFYGKEFHKKKTINNDFNNVTELLGRHKTLPIPSIVKITNLDNGLSLTIKINDRHDDNSSLIQVSRKTAQLLRFYKDKIAKVRIEILSDSSKQMKIVTQSMNEINFNDTIDSAPTESVSISNIDSTNIETNKNEIIDEPIEIGFEEVSDRDFLLKVYEFQSYNEAKSIFTQLNLNYKFVIQKDDKLYSLIVGPLNNDEANKLVLSFISKGYKKTEFLLE
ncbi:septal ring lytic transglycosylase RlpA family protein [Alphaproteobacteria bacterium]|nr:septal ring lytic transglycosylase RlpA family protein [Alphaproteobacteria bacterium]